MIVTKQVKSITAKTPDLQIEDQHFKRVGVLSWHRTGPKKSPYYELSPYYLKTDGNEIVPNEGGHIFENYWQGLKVYPTVTKQEIYTHYTKKGDEKHLIWKHPFEKHLDEDQNILPFYWKWREKLWNNEKSVRYPNGFQGRHRCVFAQVNDERLGYVEFRKKVYIPEYMRLIRKLDIYKELLNSYIDGENLVIYEVDVPAKGKKGLYGEVDENGIYKCTQKRLKALRDSEDEAFGHGLCLALALIEDKKKMIKEKKKDG